MRLVPFKEIFLEKINNQSQIPQLEYHMAGDCVHIGPISYTCENCFLQNHHESFAVYAGDDCPLRCPMCYYDPDRKDPIHNGDMEKQGLKFLFAKSMDVDYRPKYMTFNSNGESLLYLDRYQKYADIINRIEDEKQIKIYKHIYTNGLFADKEHLNKLQQMRVTEIRFHISASYFSEKVIENMYLAGDMGFIITVEEPSWPLYKEKFFSILPILKDIGIKHLNMIETQVTLYNFDAIDKAYPNGRYYKNALHHLYDEGLVYEIMKEVVSEKYTFSVLDCNSDVERYRRVNLNLTQDYDLMRGACEKFT